jgi:AcrR family transcriptional regulator
MPSSPGSGQPEPLFPKLPRGRSGMSPQEVASHQRNRLMRAIRLAVETHGFPATTLQEIVTLAGVSNSAFYRQFDSLEACFLATFDSIVARGAEQIKRAYSAQSRYKDKLRAAFSGYLDIVIDQPAATHFSYLTRSAWGPLGSLAANRCQKLMRSCCSKSLPSRKGEERYPN